MNSNNCTQQNVNYKTHHSLVAMGGRRIYDGKRSDALDVAWVGDSSSIDSISLFASFSLCVGSDPDRRLADISLRLWDIETNQCLSALRLKN